MSTSDLEKDRQTLLKFPEKFPIKIFGLEGDAFTDAITSIIANHVEEKDILEWRTKPSSKGKYVAITVSIMARTQLQLDAIYLDLTTCEHVSMAL